MDAATDTPFIHGSGLKEERRRPGMVRMGRGETTTPAVLPWHMDAVAERYAERDSNTLKAAGWLVAPTMKFACTAK